MASRNSLVFETDVNMDGLLSDCSNDSSTSSTENNNHLSGLMLHGSLSTNPNTSGLSNNNGNQVMFGSGSQTTMQQHSINNNNNESNTSSSSAMDKSRGKNESQGTQALSNGSTGGQSMNGGSMVMPKKSLPPNGKKTKGRVKIKMEFIDNKLRRYTTFSKRKTGIMKKAYELSTLTGTQVMLLVASETGHVYTFATRKLQPMITSDAGKALIQTCLNSPDVSNGVTDQRMSATGFEETDLTYTVNEDSSEKSREVSLHEHVLGPNSSCDQQQHDSLLMSNGHGGGGSGQNSSPSHSNGFSHSSNNPSNGGNLLSLIDSVLEPQAGSPFSLLTEHHQHHQTHHHHNQHQINSHHQQGQHQQQLTNHQMNGLNSGNQQQSHDSNGMNGYNNHVRLPPFCSI